MPLLVNIASGPVRPQLVETLRRQIAHCEGARRPQETPVSSGSPAVDQLLPGGGFHRGTLVEWLAAGDGCGEASLALVAAREACRQGGVLVVLDWAGEFYPPAVIRLGIEPGGLLVVRVANEADHAWALDQALRCPAVAAVVAWPERLAAKTFRRLQLAAEQGGSLGLLIRPEQVRHEPSWADVRLLVEPLAPLSPFGRGAGGEGDPFGRGAGGEGNCIGDRRLKVQLLRGRGGASGGSVEVEIDHETRTVHLDSQLAAPADRRRAAGA
jgi:protein ImuA